MVSAHYHRRPHEHLTGHGLFLTGRSRAGRIIGPLLLPQSAHKLGRYPEALFSEEGEIVPDLRSERGVEGAPPRVAIGCLCADDI